MKVFVSSLITGMEDVRASAAKAIEALGHTVVRAEDFDAMPTSSRAACLAAVRASDAMVLILGEQYGAVQASSLSATHEEFNEAREHSSTFVFVREGISPDQRQAAFIKEARDWQSGRYTADFGSPDQLQQRVTTALHRWEVERASGSVDAEEMIVRADALLKESGRGSSGSTTVCLAISAGPRRPVLRPSDLEASTLREELHQMALFGRARLFVPEEGVKSALEGDALVLRQKEASLSLNSESSLCFSLPLTEGREGVTAFIEENVEETIVKALEFAAAVLDRIDPVERVTHIAIALRLVDGGYRGWRTRREHAASPNSGTMGIHASNREEIIHLTPTHMPRTALKHRTREIAEDLTVLLRRRFLPNR